MSPVMLFQVLGIIECLLAIRVLADKVFATVRIVSVKMSGKIALPSKFSIHNPQTTSSLITTWIGTFVWFFTRSTDNL